MVDQHGHALRAGSDQDGFEITRALVSSHLGLETWGYWERETARAFSKHALAALDQLSPPLVVRWDAARLKPQSEDGQAALRAVMKRLAGVALDALTVTADNALMRMQLTRIARDCALPELVFSGPIHSVPPPKR